MQIPRLILIGSLLVYLTGCATASSDLVPTAPQNGLLDICLGMPAGVVGETNESLAEAFLVEREGREVCQGVVRSIKGEQDGTAPEAPKSP